MRKTLFAAAIAAVFMAGSAAAENPSFERFKDRVNAAQIENGVPEAERVVIREDGIAVPVQESEAKRAQLPKLNKDAEEAMKKVQNDPKKAIEKIVTIPASKIRAIAAKDGSILYIVDNGHFVFAGKLLDIWQQKELTTIAEVEDAVNRVSLDALGYDLWEYAAYKIGTGEKRAVIFVDPRCTWCHKLVDELYRDEAILKDYRFDIHVVPALGIESNDLAKKLYCQTETDPAKRLKVMLDGEEAINKLPQNPKCDRTPHDRSLMMAQLVGIHSVPYLIAPDGRFSIGKPADLRAFLEGKNVNPQPLEKPEAAKPAK